MTSQKPKISLEEAEAHVSAVLKQLGTQASLSWAEGAARADASIARLRALGAVISDDNAFSGRQIRFGGVKSSATSGLHALFNNWLVAAIRHRTKVPS